MFQEIKIFTCTTAMVAEPNEVKSNRFLICSDTTDKQPLL